MEAKRLEDTIQHIKLLVQQILKTQPMQHTLWHFATEARRRIYEERLTLFQFAVLLRALSFNSQIKREPGPANKGHLWSHVAVFIKVHVGNLQVFSGSCFSGDIYTRY